MPSITSLLAVLTPREKERFLPEPLFSEVQSLSTKFRLIDPSEMTPEDFAAEVTAINPDVLIGCWETLPLPTELPPRLRYMCYLTGSVQRLITRKQLEDGFLVTNWGPAISRTVAECALFHTLACLRRSTHWTFKLHQDKGWREDDFDQVKSLFERKVGIHGYGSIARQFLKLIQPFDCDVSVFAPDFDDAAARQIGGTVAESLESLFATNDIIVELAPLNPHTTRSVTETHLRSIRPGGVFVNVARAAITDEDALLRVVSEGDLQVGLDVFVQEPLAPDSPWRGLRNVSLTPHIAGPTLDRYSDAGTLALSNLRAYRDDHPLVAVITPEILDRST
ncbi:MAG: hydroxyacid dehydrogenase [Opitutaceae bacterium]|nr:hydroxyacid dehydrogenase [Opitutaceae bacterium]|tara:strand:- start:195 stop:1202 length:1008 start_codon:yes stop_codon:yes gene_type:complete